MARKHGKDPYHIIVLHGGLGTAGSAFGLARLIAQEYGVLETSSSAFFPGIGRLPNSFSEPLPKIRLLDC